MRIGKIEMQCSVSTKKYKTSNHFTRALSALSLKQLTGINVLPVKCTFGGFWARGYSWFSQLYRWSSHRRGCFKNTRHDELLIYISKCGMLLQ